MKKEPVHIREVDAAERVGGFSEVVLGYSEEEALQEAARCLQCKNPVCIEGCPVGINIKEFIFHIAQKDYKSAYFTIREKNNFPSICGRVCPAEYQCRKACILTRKTSPFADERAINIHFLERFAGEMGMVNDWSVPPETSEELKGFRVAVVGSGPAGLCCAGELARKGVQVTVYEGLHKTGGVLRYGIPPFRLPHNILDYEIDYLKKIGVTFRPNSIIGKVKTLPDLFKEGFDAVFLGLGAGIPSFLGIQGENLAHVTSANEFLTRANLMSAYKFPEYHTPIHVGRHIVVVGGGNTAMDAARVALRLQKMHGIPPDTTLLYRRSEVEMPARRLEIHHAKEEGLQFRFLVKPEAFTGNEKGMVQSIRCRQCELGEPDATGRRRPVEIPDSDFALPCDQAIIAIGLKANAILPKVTPELDTDKHGDVTVDNITMETSIKNVFAGGDIVGGEGTVIEAMGMAKRAAVAILTRLREKAGIPAG